MAVETSSMAGAITSVIGAAAAVISAMMCDLMLAKSVAAAATTWGTVLTNDIGRLRTFHDNPAMTSPSLRGPKNRSGSGPARQQRKDSLS